MKITMKDFSFLLCFVHLSMSLTLSPIHMTSLGDMNLRHILVKNEVMAGLDEKGKLYVWRESAADDTPTPVTTLPDVFTTFALCNDGNLLGVRAGQTHFSSYNLSTNLWSESKADTHYPIVSLSCGKAGIWSVDQVGQAFVLNTQGDSWKKVNDHMKQVSSGKEVWGITSANTVFRKQRNKENWKEAAGSLQSISASEDGDTWGIGGINNLFIYNKKKKNWDFIQGAFTDVSAGIGKTAFCVTPQGELWRVSV